MYYYKPENIHILVVDDEEPIRGIMQRAIKNAGYNCITARNFEEALQALEEIQIDVVITDIVMPGESGITLLGKIKEKYNADVMVMTGFTNKYNYEQIIEMGAVDFIQKPLQLGAALIRLKRVLRERAIRDQYKQTIEAFIYRVELEKKVTNISTMFINVTLENIDNEINKALSNIGNFSGVDRSYVFLLNEDKKTMDNTHEWCAEGIEPQIENLKNLSVDIFPWWMEKLLKFETIYIPRVADLPPEASAEKDILESQDIQSLLVVPMRYGDTLLGFLGFDMVRNEKIWLEEDINLLEMLGEVFINALMREKTERVLHEAENRYRTLFNTTGSAMAIIEDDTTISLVNDEFERLSGYSKEKIEGKKSWTEFVVKEYLDRILRYHRSRRIDPDSAPKEYEFQFIDAGGNVKYILMRDAKIPETKKSIASLIDITEQVQAKKVIQESEERFQSLLNSVNDIVWSATLDGSEFLYLNPSIECVYGRTCEEFKNNPNLWIEVVHPDDAARVQASNKELFDKGSTELEYRIIRPDDEIRWLFDRKNLVYDSEGKPIRMGGIATDITERKRAEEDRQRLYMAIEQLEEIVSILDINNVFTYINPAFESITGYKRDEVIGKTPQFLAKTDDELLYKEIWDDLTNGKKWSGRLTSKRKDGADYILDAIMSPVLDESRTITSYVVTLRDITDELLIEKQIREKQKMEAIGTLAGGIAHDFNNILTAIIGYTELLMLEVSKGSQVYSDLERIYSAGHRARDLVNQILTFSRQREQEKRPILIVPIIKEALKLLRASLPSSIEIRKNIESETGTVLADPTQIHQVIMNLCTNAGHAMRDKSGILEVSLTRKELDSEFCLEHPGFIPGPYLKLMVSDTGHGIAPDILPRIFEPYFTTKEKSGGTGLGLSVVHGIVTSYGGVITVYSEIGKGTTFKVYLPLVAEKPEIEAEKKPYIEKGHERILFVDDEKDIIDVGKRILEQLGYTVTALSSSMDALELFEKDPNQFDLVITDMTMPFMTGDELAVELMRIRQDIPIIVCTGYSEKLTEEKALRIGIKAYMGKPLFKSEMAETVRRVLDQQSEDN